VLGDHVAQRHLLPQVSGDADGVLPTHDHTLLTSLWPTPLIWGLTLVLVLRDQFVSLFFASHPHAHRIVTASANHNRLVRCGFPIVVCSHLQPPRF
jgi:hypothetical protein